MTPDAFDHELRELFQQLKEEDRRMTPEFREIMAGATRIGAARRRSTEPDAREHGTRLVVPWSLRTLWKAGLLAAAAATAFLLIRSPGTSDAEFELVVRSFTANPALGAWRSPTDNLLNVPGMKMLSTVPSLGTRGWPEAPDIAPGRNQL